MLLLSSLMVLPQVTCRPTHRVMPFGSYSKRPAAAPGGARAAAAAAATAAAAGQPGQRNNPSGHRGTQITALQARRRL